jgi:hypothetical protein
MGQTMTQNQAQEKAVSLPGDAARAQTVSVGRWLLLLAAYFALAALGRILVSNSAERDEAEQLMLGQTWEWSYGAHLPLYTWLQKLLFVVIGVNIPAVAFLKAVFLFSEFSLVFLCVKQATGNARSGLFAMLMMFLNPQFLWESQRDLSHTILATTMTLATLYLFHQMVTQRKFIQYALLGLCVSAGLLSKFNYGVFLLALMLAAFTIPEGRAVLLNWRSLLSFALIVVILYFPSVWMLAHRSEVMSDSQKLYVGNSSSHLAAWGQGLLSLVGAAVIFLAPMLLFTVPLFWRAIRKPENTTENPVSSKLIGRTVLIGLGLCVAMVFCFQVQFKVRWMQPLLILAPVYLGLLANSRLTETKMRWVMGFAVAAALAVLIILPASPLLAAVVNRPTRLNSPYDVLTQELKNRGCNPDVIVGDSHLTAGNLLLFFPHSTVLCPEWDMYPVRTNANWLIIWDATINPNPRGLTKDLIAKWFGKDLKALTPTYITAPMKYIPDQSMKLAYVELRGRPTGKSDKNATLTPTLSRRTGEGERTRRFERPDAWFAIDAFK